MNSMAVSEAVGSASFAGLLIPLLAGVVVNFIPSILAVLRGNIYRGQVIKAQLVVFVLDLLVAGVVALLGVVLALSKGILAVLAGLWGLAALVLWVYTAYHAWVDREMALFSQFGIRL